MEGHGIKPISNEIKDIKVIKSLEKRRILLKGATKRAKIKKDDSSAIL